MTLSRAAQLQKSMVIDPALDGESAKLFVLKNLQGMSVTLMDIGATWLSCEIPVGSEVRDVILGVNTMADHQRQSVYMGATIGRFANRIDLGRFDIEDKRYQVLTNQGTNVIHGGPEGFDQRRWRGVQQNEHVVCFTLESCDGDQGFPGNLQVKVTYQLSEENELSIDYKAVTDKSCPVNLTNHAYFNLMGNKSNQDCLTHYLMIQADEFLRNNELGIPVGTFDSVKKSSFDFRTLKEIGKDFLTERDQRIVAGYDHSFLIDKEAQNGVAVAARAISPDGKVMLELRTTKPAIHFYSGNYLAGTPNCSGGEYRNQSAFALETQFLPDSPNHPEWEQPCPILSPGEIYSYLTSYKLAVNDDSR
jgi:aldose 1-epimerase